MPLPSECASEHLVSNSRGFEFEPHLIHLHTICFVVTTNEFVCSVQHMYVSDEKSTIDERNDKIVNRMSAVNYLTSFSPYNNDTLRLAQLQK